MHDLSRRQPDSPGVMEAINKVAIEKFRNEGVAWEHFGFTPFTSLSPEIQFPGYSRGFHWFMGQLWTNGKDIYPAQTQFAYKDKWKQDAILPEYIAFQHGASISRAGAHLPCVQRGLEGGDMPDMLDNEIATAGQRIFELFAACAANPNDVETGEAANEALREMDGLGQRRPRRIVREGRPNRPGVLGRQDTPEEPGRSGAGAGGEQDPGERAFRTLSGEPVRALYTPADLPAGIGGPDDPVGRPGEYPYTRGIHASMYRGRLWTMRQFAGFGTSEETNERFHYLLEHGQTGLSTAFDMPSLMGHDSDHVRSLGEVGREGVAVDTLADMRTLFSGIDLGEVSVSMTINAPAAIMLAFYVAAAETDAAHPTPRSASRGRSRRTS